MEPYEKPESYKNVNTTATQPLINTLKQVEVDRVTFQKLLEANQNTIVFKFGADWCKPCKSIKNHVNSYVSMLPMSVTCCDIDIDDSFDLYAFLKSKKQVSGIPCLLAYKQGNVSFAPDVSVSGSNIENINHFFESVLRL